MVWMGDVQLPQQVRHPVFDPAERWGYELDKYQVYARFILIDNVTGYRSQSHPDSFILNVTS